MAATSIQASAAICQRAAAPVHGPVERRTTLQTLPVHSSSYPKALASCFFSPPLVPAAPSPARSTVPRATSVQVVAEGAYIEFIRGVKELTVPEVRLTRARDGSSGTATFIFEQPSVFEQSTELGDITGLYMIDDEGVMQSVEVSARFVNGRPSAIEARYIMRSEREWDRFMRFMERYAEDNGLGFTQK